MEAHAEIESLSTQLHDAYASAVRSTAAMDPVEKAIVVNAVARSSRAAEQRLSARKLAPVQQAQLKEYASDIAGEDVISQGVNVLWPSRGKLIAFLLAAVAFTFATGLGVVAFAEKGTTATGTRGPALPANCIGITCPARPFVPPQPDQLTVFMTELSHVPLPPLILTGLWILGALGAMAQWWQKTLSEFWGIGTIAKGVLARSVDGPERAFFNAVGEPVPVRWAPVIAGPISASGFVVLTIVLMVVSAGLVTGTISLG